MQKILVIGSTGKVGQALVQELARAGEHVRAATRNPSGLTPSAGLEPILFDYTNPDTFEAVLDGVNRVFIMEPQPPVDGGAHEFMVQLVEAAVHNKCKIVLMSSASSEFDDSEPLLKVEAAIKASNRPFGILRPNWFMDNFHTLWLESILHAGIVPVPAGTSRSAFVDSRDVASCAAVALRSDNLSGQTFTLTGPESLTYEMATTILSQVSGRLIRYVPIDDASFTQSLLDAGLPVDYANYITNLFVRTREGRAATVTQTVEDLTGQPPRSFLQYAKDHASEWR